MEYPATQRFVDDDEEDEDEESQEDEDRGTPLRPEQNVKIGELVVDSVTYPVYGGKDFVNKVGRIDSCSIVIDHSTISKEHAEIEAGMGSKSTFISDLGSLNKTKLNDVILRPRRLYQLQDGDNIRFGSVQAVFKLDENKVVNDFGRSRPSDDFVIPDTPAVERTAAHQVIPETPDLSFDRSSIGANCSIDVSMVAGTQEGRNLIGRSSPRFACKGSAPGLTPGSEKKGNTSKTSPHDISELEIQNNISVQDSDEENIFDMLTQQSDIHDDETQRLSAGKVHTVKPARFSVDKIECHSPSINDLETQKFPIASAASHPSSINDLETQKFTVDKTESNSCSINDLETQKIPIDGEETRFCSINDLETQKFPGNKIKASSYSINDVETQKFGSLNKDAEDSETDEEGMFEDSASSEVIDMFDAPTQLIRAPQSLEKTDDVAEEEMTQLQDPKPKEIKEENVEKQIQASVQVETCTRQFSVDANEEKRATLNDSIESKLNHMFDDVNESRLEEPTQMLTQHLETILDSTQVGQSEHDQDTAGRADTENVEQNIQAPATDDNVADSDHEDTSEPVENVPQERVIRVPKLLDSEELFYGLPAVDISSRPAGSDSERSTTPSPSNVVTASTRLKRSKRSESSSSGAANEKIDGVQSVGKIGKNQSNLSTRSGSPENIEPVKSKRSKSMKNTEPRATATEDETDTTQKTTGRGKSKARKDVPPVASTAGKFEESRPNVEDEPTKEESGKRLPPKKRGRLALSNPPTPKKIVAEVTSATRTGTRSNVNVSVETWKRPSRSSAVGRPKVTPARLDGERAESQVLASPMTMELPSKRSYRDSKSRKNNASTSSNNNSTLQTEMDKSQPISAPRTPSRRIQKKLLEKPAVVSDEETTPVKKARNSKTTLPSTVSDRREKRKNTNSSGRDGSESSDLGTGRIESPSTRSRRARPVANASSIDDENSLMGVEALENRTQSSLESQEIQAILGVVDKDDQESFETVRLIPSFRREMRIIRSQVTGNDRRKEGEGGFRGFPKTERLKETVDNRFEKPVDKPEAKKRPIRRLQANAKTEDDEKEEPSSKGVAIAKPRGRPSRASQIVNEEKKVEDPPRPAIVEQESTPKKRAAVTTRSRRGAAQKSVDRTEKENVVEEPVPKRGRRKTVEVKEQEKRNPNTEPKVSPSSSSPLRRGRSSVATPTSAAASSPRTKHKILFTGLDNPRLISIVNSLGGTITEKPNDCTALVTDKVRRTYKFLCGMAMAVPVVSVEWLTESGRVGHFLDTGDFLLEDPAEEANFKFNLRRSLAKASGGRLLEGYTIVLTPNTAPPPTAELKGMIQACGGKALVRAPTKWPEKSLIISRQEDAKNAKKILTKAPKSVRLLSVEFILTGILRHELNFDEHKLDI